MPEALNYVMPYYFLKIGGTEIQEMRDYISKLPDESFRNNQLSYEDKNRDIYVEKYRSCELMAPPSDSVFFRVGRKVFHYINSKHYQYDLSDKFEFQILRYKPGGHYEWHIDYGSCFYYGLDRKLSMSIQLSAEDEYEGGELEVKSSGDSVVTAQKGLGTLVVFDSKVTHRAKPVTKGERIVMVGWAAGPKLR
tara:strand:- start:12 stop:590 length:579 start_codon:yes stop_codon:yes gene_type:complete